jgi:c-di-AMP phosphodiesterase-like protein
MKYKIDRVLRVILIILCVIAGTSILILHHAPWLADGINYLLLAVFFFLVKPIKDSDR